MGIAINKPFLNFWYGKHGTELCNQIKRESQVLGVAVHEQIEQYFKAETQSLCSDNAQRMLINFMSKFVVPYEAKPISLEQSFEDKELKLQGTYDAHIMTNKGAFVADWKTSNSLDKITVPLQLAAYCHLSGLGLWRGIAVRIDKVKDKVEIKEYENLLPYWPIFLHCLSVAKYVKWGINE